MAALIGRVEYRLNLISTSKVDKKKRLETQNIPKETNERKHTCGDPEAGFYLVVQSSPNSRYLLSTPHHLQKNVCEAARSQLQVKVSKYALTPLPWNHKGGKKRKFCELGSQSDSSFQLLEIHQGGLELMVRNKSTNDGEETFLSLQQLYGGSRKAPYNLRGRVDSISPILNFDDVPFALMEIYDDESTKPYSCTVIIRAEALTCHDGIHPGDNLRLRNLKRNRYNPHSEVQRKCPRLANRLPSYVFQLTESESITWDPADNMSVFPPVPSTPIPLVSLQGRVLSKRKLTMHNSDSEFSLMAWFV